MRSMFYTLSLVFASLLFTACGTHPVPTAAPVPGSSNSTATPAAPTAALRPASARTPSALPTPTLGPLTPAPTRVPEGNPRKAPRIGTIDKDVTYCTVENVALKMDVYYPKTAGSKPPPAIVLIHGGAWMGGDKTANFE